MLNPFEMAPLFFVIATIYSMVGFGGGSSYIALLMLFNYPHTLSPTLALLCNIIVVSSGAYHFFKNKNISFDLTWPFLLTSIPFAFLGGLLPISKLLFQTVLAICLLIAGLKILLTKKEKGPLNEKTQPPKWFLALSIGGVLGLISGMVGIGGGIFLAPILYLMKWGKPKQIPATSCLFIFINSLSGILGQAQKLGNGAEILNYWPLFLAVFIGGQIGSRLVNLKISQDKIEKLTSLLILFVSGRLFLNLI